MIGDCNPDVLVLGDDVTPAFGQQEKLVDRVSLEIGGSAAITAVAAARLGLRVALIAAVGDDPAGTFMLDQLAREGVDVRAVIVRDGLPTGMTVALSRGGDRAILTALGAIASLAAGGRPAATARPGPARPRELLLPARGLARAGPGRRPWRTPGRPAPPPRSTPTGTRRAAGATSTCRAAIAQAGLLLPNEAEALALSGAASPGAAPPSALAARRAGPGRQARRARRPVRRRDPELHQVSLPPVTPVDTTGAGDCFNAGLIAGLLQGLPLPRAAALGCAAGALSTGALGGTAGAPGLPAATEVARQAAIRTVSQAQAR